MKITKKFAAAVCIAVIAGSAFAKTNAGYTATATTIENDAWKFMNVLDWSTVEYDKYLAFVDVGTDSTGNFAIAKRVGSGGKNVFAFAWEGNTWAKNHKNTYDFFFGTGNIGLDFTLGVAKEKVNLAETGTDVKLDATMVSPAFTFGMNLSETFGVTAGFGIPFAVVDEEVGGYDATTSVVNPSLSLGATLKLINKKTETGKLDFGYNGTWSVLTVDYDDFDSKTTMVSPVNTFYARFRYNNDVTKKLTYGFKAYCGFSFIGKSELKAEVGSSSSTTTGDLGTLLVPTIYNGVKYALKPTVDLMAGVSTSLPTVKCADVGGDNDFTCGDLSNTYYAGVSIKPSKNVSIDGVAVIGYENSLDDIWKDEIHLSVTAKF